MIVNLPALALAATLISSGSLVCALSSSDIPPDTPLSSLLETAKQYRANGQMHDALNYYDVAISRDPSYYLTYYSRATTYLALGRTTQAAADFDKVLSMKPDFKGAYRDRGSIKLRNGDWDGAKKDFLAHGDSAEALQTLEEAHGAATLAFQAEKEGNWEECISQSGAAIVVAGKMLSLRKTRTHCRFEKGEVLEGMSDLGHVLQMQPGLTDPHIQISAITFYALADFERGMDQLRKCLHSDPDSKSCKKLYRREKTLDKQLAQVNKHFQKNQFATALKILLPSSEDTGLVQDIKDDVKELREAGTIPKLAPNELVNKVVEMVCQAYHEMKNYKKALSWCDESLAANEHSLYGLFSKAQRQLVAENFEAAIGTLNTAKEAHPDKQQQINPLLHHAQVELKKSKTKDYYKVLGLPRDADELQIKGAYRKMVRIHHPDKAHTQGITKEDAEKKMAAINEAYEVLSDPELKQRFDQGEDPNDHEQQRGNPFQGSPFGHGGGNPFQHASHGGGGGQQFNFKFGGGGGGNGFPFG